MKIGLQIPDFSTPRGPERPGAEPVTPATRHAGVICPESRPGTFGMKYRFYPLERNSSMETASATGVSNIG